MKPGLTIFLSALLLIAVAALPSHPQIPSGRDVVSEAAYASSDPVARGANFQIAVVLKIRKGFHINAREKSADYLIATDLRANAPEGFTAGEVSYPKGELHTFSFTKTPLNVYQDQTILHLRIAALPTAPLGAQHIPLKLKYQACSNEVCLPPVTVDVDAPVNVSASADAAKPAHPELFPAP
jgi:Thiol:disulfide interchange protein DsbD, N-terminal